jgi:thiamine-monophosphate kinase
VAEGRWLGAQPMVHAMMDASDGLASDLGHICRESRVEARVSLDRVPISPAVRDAAHLLGRDPRDWATSGGEDYELIVTCEASGLPALADGLARATGTQLTAIGEIAPGEPRVAWLAENGSEVSVASGYEHFRG